MNDKERVLMWILHRTFLENMFPSNRLEFYEKTKQENIEVGDIIVCAGSGIHNWTVGTLIEKGEGFFEKPWVIKELCGNECCNVTNDSFYKVPFKIPSDVLLIGVERIIYQKCTKAIDKAAYSIRYRDIYFGGGVCTLEMRKSFSNDLLKKIEFKYNSRTTIKSILELINNDTTE
jgi:hypothetical protein